MKYNLLIIGAIAGSALLTSCGGGMSDQEFSDMLDRELDELNQEDEKDDQAKLYENEKGEFRIDFDGHSPSVNSSKVPTEIGTLDMVQILWEKSLSEAYAVMYSDYPEELIENSDPNALLQGGKNGAASNLGILSFDEENDISIDGNPGLEFTGNNGEYYVTWRVYLVDNRLYQVAVMGMNAYVPDENKSKFLESFELITDEDNE